jgi:hypothetical protein
VIYMRTPADPASPAPHAPLPPPRIPAAGDLPC